jgi:hypothetical protein
VSFARRLAAVREIVGDRLAERVMVRAEEEAPMLYELELSNGNKLEWYEIMDGIPFVAEFGSQPSVLTEYQRRSQQTPEELFRAAAPNAVVPPVLVQLSERQLEMAPVYRLLAQKAHLYEDVHLPRLEDTASAVVSTPVPPALDAADSVGKLQQSLITPAGCIAKSTGCNGALSFPWRESSVDVTKNATITENDRTEVRGVSCTHAGLVTHRVRYKTWFSWQKFFRHEAPANFFVEPWVLGGPTFDFDFEGRLYDFEEGDRATQCVGGR